MNTLTVAALRQALRPARLRIPIAKAAEQRYVLGVAYPANRLDGHSDFMRPEELEQTAWGYLRNGRTIGLYHSDSPDAVGHGEVVESYIWRGPAWQQEDVTGATQTVNPGDWMLGAIFDEPTWPLVKRMGWSIDGSGVKRTIQREAFEKGTGQ